MAVVVVLAAVMIDQGSSWGPFEDSVALDSSFRPLLVTVELTFLPAEVMIGNVGGSFRQMVADSWLGYLPVGTSESLVAALSFVALVHLY